MNCKVTSIHSSRGGTGKTMIATNLAVTYAKEGLNTAILDLDFRAPSLTTVFEKAIKETPQCYLNDFMGGHCDITQTLIDVSETYNLKGKLYVGLASSSTEAISGIAERSKAWEVAAVKRLFSLKSTLSKELNINCCIFDTSPGIQYSSINAIVTSDLAVIVTTLDSIDVAGVKNMLSNFYDIFEKKTALIINKVFPENQEQKRSQLDLINKIESTFNHPIIGIIPCYCDILQAERTRLLAVQTPNHPFIKKIEEIARFGCT